MKKLLIITGVLEAATGLALLIVPALVGHLLLGTEFTGLALVVARILGIALLALGVGCWPGPASLGMLTYNALGTVYFTYLALGHEWAGPLLWPVVVLHALLTILLARAWLTGRRNKQPGEK